MPYREVIRAKKLGGRIAGHARQHGRLVATSVTALFAEWVPPGQEFIDVHQLQLAAGEKLEGMRSQLIVIDNRHAYQMEVARQLRDRREEWVRQLREALLKLKDTVDGSFRPGATRLIFQEDPPRLPNDPVALHQLADRVFQTLTAPGFSLETSQPGVVVHPAVLAEGFAGPLQGLGATLVELDDAESATRQTQSEKDKHLEELAIYIVAVARFYEALYVLAGHKRLASRLRRSSHLRPGEDEPDPEPSPAGDGEPAAIDGEDTPPAVSTEAGEEAIQEEATT